MSLTDQLLGLYEVAKRSKAPVFAVFIVEGQPQGPRAKVLAIPKLGGRSE